MVSGKSSGGQASAGHPSCLRQVIAERGAPDAFIRAWLVAKSYRLGSTVVADPSVADDVRELRAHLEAALVGCCRTYTRSQQYPQSDCGYCQRNWRARQEKSRLRQ